MVAKKRLDHDFFEIMKREHQELIDLLGQIRHALATDNKDAGEIEKLVGNLVRRMRSHFQDEEEGGYMSKALECAPRLTPLAEQLHQQHATLLEIAGRLSSHVGTKAGTEPWWTELAEIFDGFAKQLLKHESQENDLVQEAFIQDIGTGD